MQTVPLLAVVDVVEIHLLPGLLSLQIQLYEVWIILDGHNTKIKGGDKNGRRCI